ncbi:ATP-binding protein [uncultured Sphingomonas sp.]|uniref:sensor histidine kinase n=1 Tax=uncultured Sphingomonas sp. TaxID=158754 RepID=UPI0035CBF275
MNAIPGQAVAHATIDRDGRLVEADPAIASLNVRAGGTIGAVLAVPQLATIARLARRLGIVVSRGVVVADDEADIDLWVRAQPEGDRVRLSASGWREVQPWRGESHASGRAAFDFVRAGGDWRWETDAAQRLTFVTLSAGPAYGFDALAVLGKPLTALFSLHIAEGATPLLGTFARRRAIDSVAATLKANGRSVLLSASVRLDDAGGFAGYVGIARMAEDEVAPPPPAPPPLSAAFASGLDKALRTPLARIIANADSINAQADGPLRQDYADYAADIAGAGRHLLGLVDDLVDLQAVERADFTLPRDSVDLADVARRAAGLLGVRAANAGVAIDRPPIDLAVPATGDFRRTLQILVNLISNAVRYSPRGSRVVVQAAGDGALATVTVIDAGKGIASEDQARIFDKFERVDTGEPGGSGLGLYIARRLARAMSGDLTVESAPDAGASFTLTLPAETDPARDQHRH